MGSPPDERLRLLREHDERIRDRLGRIGHTDQGARLETIYLCILPQQLASFGDELDTIKSDLEVIGQDLKDMVESENDDILDEMIDDWVRREG